MIHVFKTTVDSCSKLESAAKILDELVPDAKWNFDLEDCDNILRIDSKIEVTDLILNNGVFDCVELE